MVLLDVHPSPFFLPRYHPTITNSLHSNLPIGAAVAVLVFVGLSARVKEEHVEKITMKQKLKQFDPVGAILLLGAVFCLFLALDWGGENYPWNSSKVIGLLAGFGLLFLAFCVSQSLFGDRATIPPRILRQRTVLYGALALFSISMSSNIVRLNLFS